MSFRIGACLLLGLNLLVGTGCKTEDEKTPAKTPAQGEKTPQGDAKGQTPDTPGTQSSANPQKNAESQGNSVPTPDENPDVKKVE